MVSAMLDAIGGAELVLGLEMAVAPSKLGRWKGWVDKGWPIGPMEEGDAALERAAEWNSSFKPFNSFEMFLTEQAATQSLRMGRCQHHERALRALQMMRAVTRWDADRRNTAEDLGARIDRQPSQIARKLAGTRHGCDWLIERWEGLQMALDTPGGWDEAQITMALDMLGTPAELRKVAAAADPARRVEVVRAEIDRLRNLKAGGLDDLDAYERAAAEAGIAPDDAAIAQVKQHERSCALRMEWSHNQLKKGRHDYRPDGSTPGRNTSPTHAAARRGAARAQDRGAVSRGGPGPRRPQEVDRRSWSRGPIDAPPTSPRSGAPRRAQDRDRTDPLARPDCRS